jgi:drug/metabolite transporter (DMT)-like permease
MHETIERTMAAREWGLLLALSVLWGGSFFFVGVAVHELPTFTIVALRVGLAALVLLLVVWISNLAMPAHPRAWHAFFAMGLLNNAVPFCLIVWAQAHIASGLASILNATTPLFTVAAAHLLTTDEKLTVPRLAGAATGFAGVVLMIAPTRCAASAVTCWRSSPASRRRCPMPSPACTAGASGRWALPRCRRRLGS